MDRRSFLTAGSGVAVAGAAAIAALTPTPARAATKGSPTVFDYGAVGDGNTDDSAAFARALAAGAAGGFMVTVPAATYAIRNTIDWTSSGDVGRVWGLNSQGATLQSYIGNGTPVMRLTSWNTVRYFRLCGGMSISCSGGENYGLHIRALSPTVYFYNFLIDGLTVERAGTHGVLFEGDVFEFTVANSYFQDNKYNGMTLAQSKNGVISTVNLTNCFFNQNGQYGMACVNFDGQYGGPTDVRVYGGYARNNKSYGFYYNNGTGQAALHQVGFENNCTGLSPGDPNGAHVYALVSMNMKDCSGYNQTGGATYLLRGWFMSLVNLDGCTQGAGSTMAATGKSRLVQANGNSSGHIYMLNSSGGIDTVPGSGITWEAKNCQGPSPLGNLNIRGVMSGTA